MRNNLSNLSAETSEFYVLGSRVKSVLTTNVGVTTTYFVGNYYEVVNGVVTKYYYAGSQRIAIRENNVLSYILGDHLGSNSIVTDSGGNVISNTKYKAWGEVRYSSGSNPSEYTYTGQYSYVSDFGLMFYNARWYDSSLGRFAQADTIVPSGVQGLDRYAAMNNNPIRYSDPTGHFSEDEIQNFFGVDTWNQVLVIFEYGDLKDRWGWLLILEAAEIGDNITINAGDETITGSFELDVSGQLIVAFDEQNYFIDQEKAGLLGDSFELTKEIDLSDYLCTPFYCTIEYTAISTDAVRKVPPHHYIPPNDLDFGVGADDYFDAPMDSDLSDSRRPLGGGGGPSGILEMFVVD